MKKNIIILLGGNSPERDISIKTGNAVYNNLIKEKWNIFKLDPADYDSLGELISAIKELNPYIVFIALHGAAGENGQIQAILEYEKISFTGSDHKTSALCMDKQLSTDLAAKLNIRIPKTIVLKRIDKGKIDKIKAEIKFPCVLKPIDTGSSVGIHIVKNREELKAAFKDAVTYSERVLFQEYIPGRELTVSVLGNNALPLVEIAPKDGWYDFKNKYTKGNTNYICPAELEDSITVKIKETAKDLFDYFNCFAYARVDFRYDNKNFYFLEINTLPGMTELSLTPMAAKEAGLNFSTLLDTIIKESKRRNYD